MSPKKITVIIAIPVLFIGGTEVQTLNLVRVLAGNGYGVTVCCYYNEFDQEMIRMMESAGAHVELLGVERSQGAFFLCNRLRQFFLENRPGIVHVQYIAPGLIPLLAARAARVPKIFATVHQPGRTYGWKPVLLLRFAAKLCTLFFCNSLAVEKSWFGSARLFEAGSTPLVRHCTIYNAVDADRIAAIATDTDRAVLRAALNIGNRPVLGVVGRLRREKGQAVLLEAMVSVIKGFPSVLLLVVGDGPDKDVLRKQSKQLGIDDNLRWLGMQTADEVLRLYGIMDILVVPSVFEGFGLAAAEAMATGLPVVASAVDGLGEIIIDNETGKLVPPQDREALADALITLLSSPETAKRMGKKGTLHLRRHFSLERFSENILSAYSVSKPADSP